MSDQAAAVAVAAAIAAAVAWVAAVMREGFGGGVGSARARGVGRDARTVALRRASAVAAAVAGAAWFVWLASPCGSG